MSPDPYAPEVREPMIPSKGYAEAAAAHDPRCLYCAHGPYCTQCPPPGAIPDDAYVCAPCKEAIARSEISADPYYRDGYLGGSL